MAIMVQRFPLHVRERSLSLTNCKHGFLPLEGTSVGLTVLSRNIQPDDHFQSIVAIRRCRTASQRLRGMDGSKQKIHSIPSTTYFPHHFNANLVYPMTLALHVHGPIGCTCIMHAIPCYMHVHGPIYIN